MSILLVLLTIVIAGYTYLTDSSRVRSMAQAYLSHLLGGRVEIGGATLSIFEGLRVDDVKVHVDPDPRKPDSLLFSAQAFVVNYDPRKLIQGQLEATEIIAQKPHVYLTLTGKSPGDRWNYQRLAKNQPPPPTPTPAVPPRIALPQLLLRNAVVEISEVRGGKRCHVGQLDIDGQLTPVGDGQRYQFEMQSRGFTEGLGPYAHGTVSVNTGELTAHLGNVQFSEDIRSMFPADLRDWWERHELSGRVESVDLSYSPPHDGARPTFSVQTVVRGITLAVHREEWSGSDEIARWQRLREAVALMDVPYRVAGFGPARPDIVSELVDTAPLRLREVSGTFVFNQDAIDIKDLLVRVGRGDAEHPDATNAFRIAGHMAGYGPDAPLQLSVSSADQSGVYFPAHPRFMDSMPRDVRNFYNDLKPQGSCRIDASVDRPVAGTMPRVHAKVDIVEAQFLFRQFPYLFRGASGSISFGPDPVTGKNYVNVLHMHGSGPVGGLNEHADIDVSGRVGPLGPENPEPGFDLRATGRNVCAEPELLAAMPPDVRDELRIFDAPGRGEFPQFRGNFVTLIRRAPGPGKRMTFDTDVDMLDGSGRVVGFPYLLRHAHGKINVRDGYVDVLNATVEDGKSSAVVTGRVRWADETGRNQPLDMNLKLAVRNMPINDELIAAMPGEQGAWLKKLGVAGAIDCDGRVFTIVPDGWRERVKPGHKAPDPPVKFDLAIGIHDGTVWPEAGMFSVSSVTGKLHLTTERLDILDLHGRREEGEIGISGGFTFAAAAPRMALHVTARNLLLDRPLYAMLPLDGRKAWDEVRPEGTADAVIDFQGPLGPDQPPAVASASPHLEFALPAGDSFHALLMPRKLSVKVKTAPYPLTFTSGQVTIDPGHATLKDLVGNHGPAKLTVAGEGSLGIAPVWNLTLHAENLPLDGELRAAMPPVLRDVVDGLKLTGTLGLDFPKLTYRVSQSTDADPDVDVGGLLTLRNGSMDAGMPLTGIQGGLQFTTATRQGKIQSLSGSMALDSLNLGGRPVRDLRLDLLRAPGTNDLHIDKLRAKVAGGELGGGAVITFPEEGANSYTMNLIARDADVKTLTGETDQDIRGELTASLSLEGKWGDASARRGRGDVVVAGKQLYRIPLMLGLMQVTNLSLPIGQPFTKATARYTVEGARVNFEQMDLRADSMMMSGSGYLDFGTKQVRMTLSTDNPGGFKIPFISDLWQGARQELLKINVQGTVQDPKVQPTSMGVITTTIDQVFKGESAKK